MEQEQPTKAFSLRTVVYMAIGVGAILYYTQVGPNVISEYYFGRAATNYFHFAVISLISVLSLTAVGCSIHLRAIGGVRRGELLGEIRQGLDELKAIHYLGVSAITEVENILPLHVTGLDPRGIEALRVLKQILNAMDRRKYLIEDLLQLGRTPELCQAVEILRKKLRSIESAQLNLIDIDPFPAIPANKLHGVVTGLISDLKQGLRMAA